MSSELAIRVDAVSKAFAIYERPHHRLLQQLFPSVGRNWYREFHALRDINFEVRRGETVGIVGRNGSGKSTLLQIICGTLTPSSGRVEVNGRIAALLELGAGFNPEFTGRENVYLNASVLGLSRAEINSRFAEIEAFAEIGEFIDQPVKTYSSGMYVRLAFAVAINVDPDILIVDEALSVGDEAFQRKCFARISRIRESGATVLFVSHSAGAVVELCDRALLLDQGERLLVGRPRLVISRYHKLLYSPDSEISSLREQLRHEVMIQDEVVEQLKSATSQKPVEREPEASFDPALMPKSTVSYQSRGAEIVDPRLLTLDGRCVNVLRCGEEYQYAFHVVFQRATFRVRFGMLIKTPAGVDLAGAVTAAVGGGIESVGAGSTVDVRFRFRCLLAPGVYFLNAGALGRIDEGEEYLDRRVDVAMFRVMPVPDRLATGYVDLDVRPSCSVNIALEDVDA